MSSNFAWFDFDETSRRRMLDVINNFKEQDTVDELGIGTIRDAFANYFFPGTSTIQTRARYFLFVPWIYKRQEDRQVSSAKIVRTARDAELDLVDALIEACVDDNEGIIGRKSGRKLQRLPSSVYWVGLLQWGIRKYPYPQDRYHRSLDSHYKLKQAAVFTDDGEPISGSHSANWDPHLPPCPENFPKGMTMELSKTEAQYLQDRIVVSHGETLLAHFLNTKILEDADYFWEYVNDLESMPLKMVETVKHARDFALSIHGASLMYNLMLAQAQKQDDLVDAYKEEIDGWITAVERRWNELYDWYTNRSKFWISEPLQLKPVHDRQKVFVESWLSHVYGNKLSYASIDTQNVHSLIRFREGQLKGNRARLSNSRYLELWKGASGIGMIDYRWTNVLRLLKDIRAGLNGKG